MEHHSITTSAQPTFTFPFTFPVYSQAATLARMCYTFHTAEIHGACQATPQHVVHTTTIYQCWRWESVPFFPPSLATITYFSSGDNGETLPWGGLGVCPPGEWISLPELGSCHRPFGKCGVCEVGEAVRVVQTVARVRPTLIHLWILGVGDPVEAGYEFVEEV
ncbi:hypothetical protein BO71DRAFT_431569 [Aspergillus ellipticus CBS 707.79]|uniref:Uncharacterized protein n=1 Tax=Aspergillus ellipticus CBS 707.79 TaxID=1448320 RepID=A0A319D5U1_9EURO|nr:hypothetical protein BO71DRAFT_431569 [Aspergillus ellipticus CBS 707.79]